MFGNKIKLGKYEKINTSHTEKGGVNMNMIPVNSSDLSGVGYENGTLYIAFHSGGFYSYSGVPASVYSALLSAPSKGRYFHANIRNVYPCQRIR